MELKGVNSPLISDHATSMEEACCYSDKNMEFHCIRKKLGS